MTLRQLFYRLVSAGDLKNEPSEYKRLGRLMTQQREAGSVPRTWIVDHVRATLKPSSWSGLADFADTLKQVYRKDYWSQMQTCVEVFVEKDAIAGAIQPVTYEFDVPLRVCRGYASVSFAGEIADEWHDSPKPVFAYYVGDFDPSGFDIERDLREKLERYSERQCLIAPFLEDAGEGWFAWYRLAIRANDFENYNLIPLPIKRSDRRAKSFRRKHGEACAEVDALPPAELRRRVKEAILSHIDPKSWAALQATEETEQRTIDTYLAAWPNGGES
jgi:hypothetical protein